MATHLPRARGRSQPGYTHLTRARGRTAPQGFTHLTRAVGKQAAAINVDAGLPQTLEPFQVAQLNGTNITGDGTLVIVWRWELLSTTNPKAVVTLVGDGASAARYRTPPTLTGATLTFRVTASVAGQPDSIDTVVHTIRPHGGFWMPIGGKYVPINMVPPADIEPPVSATGGLGVAPLGTSPLGV